MQPDSPRGLYGQRPSKSADAARRAEFEEINAMTPRERMLLALELGDFCRDIQGRMDAARGKPKR